MNNINNWINKHMKEVGELQHHRDNVHERIALASGEDSDSERDIDLPEDTKKMLDKRTKWRAPMIRNITKKEKEN